MSELKPIRSAEDMIALIRTVGIIPFTKSTVPGWSVQEMTDHDFWFTTSDQLGPWDWRIEAVHDGLLCGKFLSRKSAFATEEMYRHLMNWRRSRPCYRVAEGGRYKSDTIDARLQKYLSPVLLSVIREHESLDSVELRGILEAAVPAELRKKVGGHMQRYLLPKITRQAVDFVLGFLDMGTWTVVGDITRVYRGPNCEYKGWQRNSITTPDALFKVIDSPSENPFWTKFIEDAPQPSLTVDCSPQESRDFIIRRILEHFPDAPEAALGKLIDG